MEGHALRARDGSGIAYKAPDVVIQVDWCRGAFSTLRALDEFDVHSVGIDAGA